MKFIRILLSLLLTIIIASVTAGICLICTEEEIVGEDFEAELSYLYKDIYIDGIHVNNWELDKPFAEYKGSVYIPLTAAISRAIGVTPVYKSESGSLELVRSLTEDIIVSPGGLVCDFEGLSAVAPFNLNVSIIDFASLERQIIDFDQSDVLLAEDIIYIRTRCLSKYSLSGITACLDPVSGFYISTDPDVSAKDIINENNKSYIEGRASYIKQMNASLSFDECLLYEYTFRHEAEINDIDEDYMLAMAKCESNFNKNSISRVGARGIMQIMPRTAKANGVEPDDLWDPHCSIAFGTKYISWLYRSYRGNWITAFSAYNQGVGRVSTGDYSTAYGEKVVNTRNNIIAYLYRNGYAQEWDECIK